MRPLRGRMYCVIRFSTNMRPLQGRQSDDVNSGVIQIKKNTRNYKTHGLFQNRQSDKLMTIFHLCLRLKAH